MMLKKILPILLLLFIVSSCNRADNKKSGNQEVDSQLLAVESNSQIVDSNLIELSELIQKTGLMKQKADGLKILTPTNVSYFKQIESAILTQTKQQEDMRNSLKALINSDLDDEEFDKQKNMINFADSQKEYKETIKAIRLTLNEIEAQINYKLNIK